MAAGVALALGCTRKSFDPIDESFFTAPTRIPKPAAFEPQKTPAREFDAHEGNVNALAWSPDGAALASAGYGSTDLALWRADGTELVRRETPRRVTGLAWAGDTLLTVDVGGVLTYQTLADSGLGEPEPVQTPLGGEGGARGIATSLNGKLAALIGWRKPLVIWDVAGRKPLRQVAGGTAAAFSPGGRLLAVGGEGGAFRIVDLATGTEKSYTVSKVDKAATCTGIAWSDDSAWLATGHNESTFSVWEAVTMIEKHNHFISGAGVMGLAFTADGKTLATIQAGRAIYLWDPATRNIRGILDWPDVESIAPSPAGGMLAAGGKTKAIRIWE